jgi:hypothetical protein
LQFAQHLIIKLIFQFKGISTHFDPPKCWPNPTIDVRARTRAHFEGGTGRHFWHFRHFPEHGRQFWHFRHSPEQGSSCPQGQQKCHSWRAESNWWRSPNSNGIASIGGFLEIKMIFNT